MRRLLCSMIAVALTSVAAAGPPQEAAYAPAAPDARAQLAASEVKLVEGQGGLLVPALATEQVEPRFALVDGQDTRVFAVGERIALDPGRYVVLVGSVDPSEAVAIPVVVEAGRDTIVPFRWGGLRVETVNRRGKPAQADVRVERVSTGTPVATPARLMGETAPTMWLLPPGLYRVSSQPDAGTKDAATVHVPAGGYVRYQVELGAADRLVGARVMEPEGMPEAQPAPSGWSGTVALGADASFTQNQATPGFPEVLIATGSASLDVDLEFVSKRHRFDAGAGIREGGFLFRPPNAAPLPIIKTRDRLYADLGYQVRFNAGQGIYVRTSGETRSCRPPWR